MAIKGRRFTKKIIEVYCLRNEHTDFIIGIYIDILIILLNNLYKKKTLTKLKCKKETP